MMSDPRTGGVAMTHAETKRCPRCGREKPLAAFNRRSTTKDGLQVWCRDCQAAAKHDYDTGERRREAVREYNRRYYAAHPELREKHRRYNWGYKARKAAEIEGAP